MHVLIFDLKLIHINGYINARAFTSKMCTRVVNRNVRCNTLRGELDINCVIRCYTIERILVAWVGYGNSIHCQEGDMISGICYESEGLVSPIVD